MGFTNPYDEVRTWQAWAVQAIPRLEQHAELMELAAKLRQYLGWPPYEGD